MSRLEDRFYYFAKITLEAETPLMLASGKSGIFFDVELVRDANNLPAIPGTTIVGLLRHSISQKHPELVDSLFGQINDSRKRNISALECSWAYVHDSNNKYHKSFIPREQISKDSILKELAEINNPNFVRDHVRLSDKGVAIHSGKFDRSFVPAGTRFTFTLGLWQKERNNLFEEILSEISKPTFRIGGAGRAGYGKTKVINILVPQNAGAYDIVDLENFRTEKLISFPIPVCLNFKSETISLRFPQGFRIGGGTHSFLENSHAADMLPYSEITIQWNSDHGQFTANNSRQVVIPGSSIKGALRHRAAFHLARIKQNWVCENQDAKSDGLEEIFGSVDNDRAVAGKVWFSDIYLKQNTPTYQQARNSIDRFTGGTRKGALFQEENVRVSKTLETTIYFDTSLDLTTDAYKAFSWALEDLKNGRLAIGGGSGHGLGFNKADR